MAFATTLPALSSPEVAADPHAFYRVLRDEHPLHRDPETGHYLLSRFEHVDRGYRDPVFTTRAYEWLLEPIHGVTILQLDGLEHSRRRRILTPVLHGNGLDDLRPVVERLAAECLDDLERVAAERGEADLVADFAHRFPVSVIATMLDLPPADHDLFRRWYTTIVAALANYGQDEEVRAGALAIRDEITAYLLPLIRARRADPGDDFVSRLTQAEVDGDTMDDAAIKAFASLLLVAGAETTDKTFASLFANLLADRARYEAVQADPSLVPAALAETLRCTPPTQINIRETAEDVELDVGTIPAGSTVLLLIGSANRDPRRFADPDTFDLHRADLDMGRAFTAGGAHVAFGGGRHFCLGAQLARVELETVVHATLERFPGLRLADGFEPRQTGVKMRCPAEVRVVLS